MNRQDGVDQISASVTDASVDKLTFDMRVNHDQLWFVQSGQDLVISIIGTSHSMTVKGWYTAGNDQVDRIEVSDGDDVLTSEVDVLVTAIHR